MIRKFPFSRVVRSGGVVAIAVALAALVGTAPAPATAQGLPFGGESENDEPIEVDASEALEWREEDQVYIARGDARMRQGSVEVRGDVLTAHYREGEDGNTEIWRFEAQGNVIVESPTERSTGDYGIYEMDDDVFRMTGSEVTYETATETITATDELEYRQSEGIATARGNARAINRENGNNITADVLVANFDEDDEGERGIRVVTADGNVVVRTDEDVARGAEGVYDLATGLATLTGNVRLTRGQNQMNGDVAEVNMETGISRLVSDTSREGSDGRVRGLLFSN